MSQDAIRVTGLGKMYKLYRRRADKVLDAFGLIPWVYWREKARYQAFWALRHLDLEIRKGERVGIIGQNGAGKSTFLKIIAGNITPTEGSVEVAGRIQALLELGTGFHPEFTGRENIRASLALNGMSPAQIREKEEEIIDFAELDDFIDQPLKTYSAGMYTRLAFSTATAIEPEILIIDEVLGAGDAYFGGKCVERMKRLTHDSDATVLFVSHDLGSVQALCQRVVWLHRGQVREDGDPLEVIKGYATMVREDEAIRLRARDLKVMKKQAVLLDRFEDIYDTMLFHLVTVGGAAPSPGQRIYSLALNVEGQEVARIEVGGPMDNSAEHFNYLMDNPGFMDWGPPKKDEFGAYREYADCNGKYRHAPFEFAIPKTFRHGASKRAMRLDIVARVSQHGIAVEVYNGKEYARLGSLNPAQSEPQSFEFSDEILKEKEPGSSAEAVSEGFVESGPLPTAAPAQAPAKAKSEYGQGGARITGVRMLNSRGEETRVFTVGESMKVVFEYEAQSELLNPAFVFCAYLPDGKCASQWIATSRQMGRDRVRGRGRVAFHVDRLAMGRSAYVASAGIFKSLRSDGQEAVSYHVLDRCIHFQVLQDLEGAHELGLCAQPFVAEMADGG